MIRVPKYVYQCALNSKWFGYCIVIDIDATSIYILNTHTQRLYCTHSAVPCRYIGCVLQVHGNMFGESSAFYSANHKNVNV